MKAHRDPGLPRSGRAWIYGPLAVAAAAVLWNVMREQDYQASCRRQQRLNEFSWAAGDSIVWLQQQYVLTGAYPTSIPAEVRAPLDALEPGWSYSVSTNRSKYWIGFGHYMEDGFQHYWSSERGRWMTDS